MDQSQGCFKDFQVKTCSTACEIHDLNIDVLISYLTIASDRLIELRLKVPVNNMSVMSRLLPERGREKRRMG